MKAVMDEDIIQAETDEYEDDVFDQGSIDLSQFQTPFSKEDLINQYSLRNSDYKTKLNRMIDESDLYESGKRAFKDTVLNFFDQTWKLANFERRHGTFMNKNSTSETDEIRGAMLSLKLTLLKNTASMCRSDRNSPDYLVLTSNIVSHFKAFISQAKHGNERKYQAMKIVKQENVTRNVTEPQTHPTRERKKLWG